MPFFSFPFLFSGYVCSVKDCVVRVVSVGCNQASSAFLNIVFESLYRCIDAVFNAGKSSPSFFS